MKEGDVLGLLKINKIYIFLIRIMIMTALLCCSSQVQAAQDGDYTYTVTDGKAQITKYIGTGGNVTIPSTLGGYPVTSIGNYAFSYCSGLTSISLSQGLTSIGNNAFQYCDSLTSINLTQGVTSIGNSAFYHCRGLTSISLPVTSIGISAFSGCSGLTSISLPVTSIGDYAFSNCSGLTSISLPQEVISIGEASFSFCTSLTNISVAVDNINYKSIDGVLYNKDGTILIQFPCGLTGINLPQGVTSIANYAFSGCTGLTSINLSQGVTSIGNSAFSGCSGLTSISLSQGLTSIGNRTFSGCSGLTSISLPQGVTSIGNYAFSSCDSLTSISLPQGVTSIGMSAFSSCYSLTSISLPQGVTSIGDYAFIYCQSLTSISLSQGLTSIGNRTFSGCSGLTSISLPQGVTSIGNYAFQYCDSLTSISLLQGLTSIGNHAFSSCDSLTSISLPQGITSISEDTFEYCYSLTSISLPQGVTSIGNCAFSSCYSLTSVSLPQGLTSIGDSAFSGCSGLTSISLSQGLTSIGNCAFSSCYSLTSISLPQGLTSIGDWAFSSCIGLTGISLPQGVTSIGDCAFKNCTGLTTITFNSATTTIADDSYTIPVATKIIGFDPSTAKTYASKYNRKFEVIDSVPETLSIVSTDPLPNDYVPLNKKVTIAFNKNIQQGDNFDYLGIYRMVDGTLIRIKQTVGINGNTLVIQPEMLLANQLYYVELPAGSVKDESGNSNEAMEYTFSTEGSSVSLTVDNESVTVMKGEIAVNHGTYSNTYGEPITLSADIGEIKDNGDGTWTWTCDTTNQFPFRVFITANGNPIGTYFNLIIDSKVVIFIPGVMGSELSLGDKVKWINPYDAYGIWDLRLDEEGNSVGDITATRIMDGEPANAPDAYSAICNRLENEGYEVIKFPYDWRLSYETNAERLNETIDDILSTKNISRVNIISHSMGGLVTKAYINKYSGDKIKKWIACAPPQLGAPVIFYIWKTGDLEPSNIFDKANLVFSRKDIRMLMRNCTSFYQTLPSEQYFAYYPGYYTEFADTDGDGINSYFLSTFDKMYNWLENRSENINDINIDLVNKGVATHRTMDDIDIVNRSDFEGYIIAGESHATPMQLLDFSGNNDPVVPGTPIDLQQDMDISYFVGGDGTVPIYSATCGKRTEANSNIFYLQKGEKHGGICNDNAVITKCIDILEGNLGSSVANITNAPPTSLPDGYSVKVQCPVELSVTDSAGQEANPENMGTDNIDYFILGDTKIAYIKDSGFKVDLKGTGTGSADLTINRYIDGQITEGYKYLNIPVNSATQAKLDATQNIGNLLIDQDGDGTVDFTKSPDYILSGNLVNDFIPPTINASKSDPNANGWYNSDVTVSFTASDNESGIDSVPSPVTLSTEGAKQSVTGYAYDKAGNKNSLTVDEINIDKTGPEINITEPINKNYQILESITLSFEATDALSGVDTCEGILDGEKVTNGQQLSLLTMTGDHKLSVTATDKAGNSSSLEVSFTIKNDIVPIDLTVPGESSDTSIPTLSSNAITRIAGQDRIDTALAIAKASYSGKVDNVILATADNYPDALAGSVLAYKLNAPILLVGSTDADQEKILDYLKYNLNTTGTVYILGGTAVVSSTIETKVTNSGFHNIIRLGGADRYETAVKIADQLGVKTGNTVVLVNGENYPDALSISSEAAILQSPILLVPKEGLSDAVKKKIVAIAPAKVYLIGLQGVISTDTENQLAQITSLDKANIVRIGGADRYATSLAVAEYFNLSGQSVCVATGSNFPDALTGSVYAANHNAPIILVDGRLSDRQINYLKTRKMTGATIFGGEAAVSSDIEQQLGQLIKQ
jgi:putative cell wall-binding protein/pimeloyl-ACP methyl ester carboxylesterase